MDGRSGGSGKTTTAALLALWWAEHGRTVVLVDGDQVQGSAAAFAQHVAHPRIQAVAPEQAAKAKADVLILDSTGGIEDTDLRHLVQWADVVVVPVRLGPTDLRSSRATVLAMHASAKARLLLNCVDRKTVAYRERDAFAAALGVPALQAAFADRVAYRQALVDGWSALHSVARAELGAVALEIEKVADGKAQ